MRSAASKASLLLIIPLTLLACATFVRAETNQDEMHATIMAALLSDPRTSTVSPSDLQALVNILAEQATAQGLNAQDVKWQVAAAAATFGDEGTGQSGTCTGIFPALCPFSDAFGFTGGDIAIPLILFGSTGLLLFILYEVIKHHRKKLDGEKGVQQQMPVSTAVPSTPVTPPAPPSQQTPPASPPTPGVAQ